MKKRTLQGVTGQDLSGPLHRVFDSDAGWLRLDPQLEPVESIVVANTVFVMNGLIWEEVASKVLLHHEDVLEHVAVGVGGRVVRAADEHIALIADVPSALPGRVILAGLALPDLP